MRDQIVACKNPSKGERERGVQSLDPFINTGDPGAIVLKWINQSGI
jgi:hypothetical protein